MKVTLEMQVEFMEIAIEEIESGPAKEIMQEILNNLRAIREAEDDFNEFVGNAPIEKVLH